LKILHSSDWHLGQNLRGYDRSYEHQCFLDWLLLQIQTNDSDALLVCGDIFDNANPSSASQKQLYRFLQAAREAAPHLRIVLIAGNHDSPSRLEAPSPLLDFFDTLVVGQTRRNPQGEINLEQLLIPLHDRHNQLKAWCLAVPFLRPGDVPRVEGEGEAYLTGVAALYRQTLQFALDKRKPDQAIVALGHCHLQGGNVSQDSERRIVIGGLEMLSAAMFDERIAYAALGHLHLAQAVGGKEWIRYSGSPIPLSFAETHYHHQVIHIELDGAHLKSITSIPVPRAVELLRIPTQPAPLADVLEALADWPFPDVAIPVEQHPFVEVRIRYDAPEPGARTAIENALKDKPVRFAGIDASYRRGDSSQDVLTDNVLGDLSQMQPEAILQKHYQTQYGNPLPNELLLAFQTLLLEPAEDDL